VSSFNIDRLVCRGGRSALALAGLLCAALAAPASGAPLPRGLDLAQPLAWQRDEPKPQGSFGIQERPAGRRSLTGALWRSALLPGLGQRYLGAPGRGLLFMGAEAATWGTWGTFKTQEWLREENYIEMAQVFAGVAGDEHEDDYWKAVGQHASWLDYNEWLRYQARREYGYGTDAYYDYIAENEVGEALAWDWNSDARRAAYLDKREASNSAERRATYTLYALLVNRVVSLVDVWRLHRDREAIRDGLEREAAGDAGGIQFGALPAPGGLALRLGWVRCF
jgi:hypothetical protein